jgi:tRNA nucleotidyltransferase (CCA-adding enzyme)
MKNYLSSINPGLLRVIREAGEEAGDRQLSAYIVGGFVRDILLNKRNLDLDIVIEGDAIHLAESLAKKWGAGLTVHRPFGTAVIRRPEGLRLDLAMAREEYYPRPGALPVVRPGSIKADLLRRDFTVNAMAIAITPDHFGRLLDEFGGLADLVQRKVRILHGQSFIDDPTRILRAVRFEQRFGFRIERATLALLKSALREDVAAGVKPPRYFNEFKKVLREPDPLACLKRLDCLEGLYFIDPRLKGPFYQLSRIHRHRQKVQRKPLYKGRDGWWLVYLMGLLNRVDVTGLEMVLKKFSFTKEETRSLRQGRAVDDIIKSLSSSKLSASRAYRILKPLTEEVVLLLRVCTSRAVINRRVDRFLARDIRVKLEMDGEDLKKMGAASGREMGRVLEHVLYLKIDQRVKTKQEELTAALLSLGKY